MSDATFTLKGYQVGHIIDLGVCISKDEARPTLTGMKMIASQNELVLVGTDSYRLGVIVLAVDAMEGDADLLVKHSQLVRILKFLRAEVNHTIGSNPLRNDVNYKFVTDGNNLKVTIEWVEQATLPVFEVLGIDGTFPKWEGLFNEPWRASERTGDEFKGRIAPKGLRFPQWNAMLLADFEKLLGPRSQRPYALNTVTISHTTLPSDEGNSALKPWCFTAKTADNEVQITYLLMPLRPEK